MNDYLFSFILYAIPANIVAAAVVVAGTKKMQVTWHPAEYLFIYLPWLSFIALTFVIFGGFDNVPELGAVKVFLLVFQSIGSGLMGGLVLMPRLVIKKSKLSPLTITAISATCVAILYTKFRMLLFIMVEALSTVVPA
ncbi:MAG: hypothetical protein R8K54_04740 [Mariprofundaceae bacterium]